MASSVDNAAAVASPVEIFFSYSHEDEKLRDRLDKHLSVLKAQGVTTHWHDRRITAGREWAEKIDEHLNTAQVILLLISEGFVASHYCYQIEMPRAMERHEAKEARVIPVLLRDVDSRGTPFEKLNPLPTNFKAVSTWRSRDRAFTNVAVGIRRAVEELREERVLAGLRSEAEQAFREYRELAAKDRPDAGILGGAEGAFEERDWNRERLADAAQERARQLASRFLWERERLADRTKARGLSPIWNVPHPPNPNFTGRENLLKKLYEFLSSGELAALTQAMVGLGGVGKTQTAVEYCYRHAADYELVWWIRSEEPGSLAADYAALASALGLPEKDDQDQRIVVRAVREALSRRGRWLLVFDNAIRPEDIREYLPRPATGHVFVTSRNPALGGTAQALKVPIMSAVDAVTFLLKRAHGGKKKDAAVLARELGYLPLALEHAGAYVEKSGSSFSRYLELFRTRQHDILGRAERPDGYAATVATTWEISFREVEKESEAARQLMNLCAFLAPDDIGRGMLRAGAAFLPEPLAATVADDLLWDDAVATLRKYSLVEVQDAAISVHRLVQAVVRDRLSADWRNLWSEGAVGMVNPAFPYKEGDVKTWAPSSRVLPHALAAAGHAEKLQVGMEACGRVLNEVGLYAQMRAELPMAKAVLERAVRIGEAAHGPDHPTVADRVSNLGCVLQHQGDLAGARASFGRALKIDETAYGPDHPTVAIGLNNLGCVLRDLGDLAGARAALERALRMARAAYGPDHPQVAAYVNNLGGVLRYLGDLAGARACYKRAIGAAEAAHGPDHPQVAAYVNNLGGVLQDLGDLVGARACYERALRTDEAAYGPDHPGVATDVNNLGSVLRDLGDSVGARASCERALKILERRLGKDHPRTLVARRNFETLDWPENLSGG